MTDGLEAVEVDEAHRGGRLGVGGTAADTAIQADLFRSTKRELDELQSVHTGQPIEQIERDSDRDRWSTAQEALQYGSVGHVVSRAATLPRGRARSAGPEGIGGRRVAAVVPPVVDPSWLRAHRPDVVLADVRWYLDGRSGRAAYDAGHLPGAVFVDLDRWLAAPADPGAGRHPLPEPEVFAEGMAGLGIGDADPVVAYDDAGGVVAARLVWMLRVTGHEAALLDGGVAAWEGPLEQAAPEPVPAVFTPRPWPAARLAGVEDVLDPAAVVIDARDPDRYRGDREPVDPRAGHVPGAVNVPARAALDGSGRFRPVEELRRTFAAAGVTADSDVVSYCGSGVTACHDLLALELAGLPQGRLYAGSWSQYSAEPDRPVAVGDRPS